VFTGTHHNGLDAKGRTSVPADYRSFLTKSGDEVVHVWRSFNGPWLEGADGSFMERLSARLDEAELYDEGRNSYEFLIFGSMRPLAMDKTGRITLPREFVEHAGLEGQAVFVGFGKRFEIMTEARHQDRFQRSMAEAPKHKDLLSLSRGKG
jgi:MraZ protein